MNIRQRLVKQLLNGCRRMSDATEPTLVSRLELQKMLGEQQTFRKGEICDHVTIYARGGAGGGGLPRKNGTGGDGGSVWLQAMPVYQNLNHLNYDNNRKYVAGQGDNSSDALIRGRTGEDCIVEVPLGTVATDLQTGKVLCDVNEENKRYLLQGGGKGGSLVNNYRSIRAKERWIKLVLKSIADVGLVGYPNAGKSSLLSMISNASATVGSYPFTTLKPTVGHLITTNKQKKVGIADIPGLIEGASDNRGLGHVFLQHIERTSTLLFVIDVQGFQLNYKLPRRTPFQTFGYLCRELELYMGGLITKRPIIVAVNKMDTPNSDEEYSKFVQEYQDRLSGLVKVRSIVPVSCYTGQGLEQLEELLFEVKYGKEKSLGEVS